MRSTRLNLALACGAVIATLAMGVGTAQAQATIAGGGTYTTIQAAIDAAALGSTINVAAGTYHEQITITKALTINGADGAVLDGTPTLLTPPLATTAWTTGVKIKSGNVTFNNVDVTNFRQDGIIVGYEAPIPGSLQNVHVTNCKVSNIQPGNHGFGIYVGYQSEDFKRPPLNPKLTAHLDYSGLLIENNEITGTKSSALVLQSITGIPGTLMVRNNNIHHNITNSGIWIDSARNLVIEDNIVDNNKWGIESSSYGDAFLASGYPAWNYDWSPHLNGLYGPKDILIRGNEIVNNQYDGVAVYDGHPATISIHENIITGNVIVPSTGYGVNNYLTEDVSATNNWWGHASGPSGVGLGTGDSVSAHVVFNPWRTGGIPTLVSVARLEPSWTAPGGGGVFSSYAGYVASAGGPPDYFYPYVSPGTTAVYDALSAGIIKAGLVLDPDGHYWDDGIFGFMPTVTIDAFAATTLTYDVVNQHGENPVWMTIEIDTGMVGDRNDNTVYQFVPTTNPAGWHTVDAATGRWQKWADNQGTVTGPLMLLSGIARAHTGLNVARAYLRLGMGDSYHGINGLGTVAWVDKATLGGVTYDFVVDTTAPVVTVPANMTVEATSASGAVATFSAVPSAVDDVDGPLTPICSRASGATFTLGSTSVICTATDSSGNEGSATFTVTVVDTTPPAIDPHANVTATATSATGAVLAYTSPASHDAVGGNGTATCLPASGTTFPIGATTVTCTATDAAGNTALNVTFTVSVTKPVPKNANECKSGGWTFAARANGTPFKNQGACVQYVNTGK